MDVDKVEAHPQHAEAVELLLLPRRIRMVRPCIATTP